MISNKCRRRPGFETMEDRVVPSGTSLLGQQNVAALFAREPRKSASIVLSGKAEGTYRMNPGVGEPIHFTAIGNIQPVGLRTANRGTIRLTPQGYVGSAILSVARGGVHVSLSSPGPGSLVLYTITGGAGHFAGSSGHGAASFTSTPGRNPDLGKFTITFLAPTS